MSQRQKLLAQLLNTHNPTNLDFTSLVNLLVFLGFEQRVRGSHHLFTKTGIAEIINIQPAVGNSVKPYQANQVRAVLVKYRAMLGLDTI